MTVDITDEKYLEMINSLYGTHYAAYHTKLNNMDDESIYLIFLDVSTETTHCFTYNASYCVELAVVFCGYNADIVVIDKNTHRLKSRYMSNVFISTSIFIDNINILIIDKYRLNTTDAGYAYFPAYISNFKEEMCRIVYKNTIYIPRVITKERYEDWFENIDKKYENRSKGILRDMHKYILMRYYSKYLKGYFTFEAPVEKKSKDYNTYMNMICNFAGGIWDENIDELREALSHDNRDYNYYFIMDLHNVKINKYNTYDNKSKYWNICDVSINMINSVTKDDIIKYWNDIMSFIRWYMIRRMKELRDPNGLIRFIKVIDIVLTADKRLIVKFGYKGDKIEMM